MSFLLSFGVISLVVPVQLQDGGSAHQAARPGSLAPPEEVPVLVRSASKLSNATPGFADTLDQEDWFGSAACGLGDLDGDGVPDVVVGASGDDDSNPFPSGALWVLFLNADGSVRARQKISALAGGLEDAEWNFDALGLSFERLGDLDGDGTLELAAGAPNDDDGGFAAGAVHFLSLRPDGTVAARQKISALSGGFGGALEGADFFGMSVAALGDLDGDGVGDLAVGASGDDDGDTIHGGGSGAVWVLFMNADRTVRAFQKLSATAGGFAGPLVEFDQFGSALASVGDLDGDGRAELAASAPFSDTGGDARGAVWILFLNADGTVRAQQRIGSGQGAFTGTLRDGDLFGRCLVPLGDTDGDGFGELLVGAPGDRDGGPSHGAVWLLSLEANGTVHGSKKISDTQGGFTGQLSNEDTFGWSAARCGDVDGDGHGDLLVGARGDDDGGLDHGAAWVLFLDAAQNVSAHQKISDGEGGMLGTLDANDGLGESMAAIGDLDGDGLDDFAGGAPGDDSSTDVFASFGAIWVLFRNADGSVREYTKIGRDLGGFTGRIDDRDEFAVSLVAVGDLDGDGIVDLAAGAPGDDDGPTGGITDRGAVWILFLNRDGTVRAQQKISATQGGLNATPTFASRMGHAMASLGDFDGDGLGDLVVGSPGEQTLGAGYGALWILMLNADGTVKARQRISAVEGGFTGHLDSGNFFGSGVAALGDLDGDGVGDVAAGAPGDHDADGGGSVFTQRGAIWILFLNADGTVKAHQKISDIEGDYPALLEDGERLGQSLARVDDLDGDGVDELASGLFENDGHYGGVWQVLFLRRDGTVKLVSKVKRDVGGFTGELERNDSFGSTGALSLGDRNGDGLPEVLVGAVGDDDGANDHGAVWQLFMEGLVRAGFERESDLRTPLVDGQSLAAHQAYEPLFSLSGSGDNLGLALFDSRANGPHALGSRPDLLVGRGHLLILQDSLAPAQSPPGVFAQPQPDPDGGRMRFYFAAPRRPLSLDLVDIDASTSATVYMLDRQARSRVYTVPAGWTGDRIVDGTAGVRTLDLTALLPQRGFASTARVTNSLGFDDFDVERLIVLMQGGGAVDALVLDPHPRD